MNYTFKIKIFLGSIIAILISPCNSCFSQNDNNEKTILCGRIIDSEKQAIKLSSTSDTFQTEIKDDGTFRIEFFSDRYSGYKLFYDRKNINLIINKGDSIHIETNHQNFETKSKISGNGAMRNQKFSSLAKGNSAPNFTMMDRGGNLISLNQLKGKYILIDIWSMTCSPCIKEMPELKKIEEEFSESNIVFVGIAMDKDYSKWKKFLEKKDLKGIQLFGGDKKTSDFAQDYCVDITGKPRFVLLDTNLNIIDSNCERPTEGLKNKLSKLLNTH